MQKRIFIHVGPPKTGSSAIQLWLHQNVKYLSQNKILYPLHNISSNGISSGNLREIYDVRPDKTMQLNYDKAKGLLSEFEKGPYTTLLLSSEFFLNKLEELKTYFVTAKFIFYVRNPVEVRESNYNQSVKRHGKTTRLPSPKNNHLPHLEKLVSFHKKLGNTDIILKFYGQSFFHEGNIISDFLSVLGLTVSTETKSINKSYQFEALEFKRWINRYNIQHFETTLDNALQNFDDGCSDYSLFNQKQYLEQCTVLIEKMGPIFKELNVVNADKFFNSMLNKSVYSYKEQDLSDEQFLLITNFLQKEMGRNYNKLMYIILKGAHDKNCRFIGLLKDTKIMQDFSNTPKGISYKFWLCMPSRAYWRSFIKTILNKLKLRE